jgi:putative transposase
LSYVSLNPVRARLVGRAQDWPWSSVRAHLRGRPDRLTTLRPVRERYPNFANFLDEEPDAILFERLRQAEGIGRPLGSASFLDRIERMTRRSLRPAKRGPKPRAENRSRN